MFHAVREALELDAERKASQAIKVLGRLRSYLLTYYLTLSAGLVAALIAVFLGAYSSEQRKDHTFGVLGVFLATLIVLASELLRSRPTSLAKLAGRLESRQKTLRDRIQRDFLFWHYWSANALLWLPLIVILLILVWRGPGEVRPLEKDAPNRIILEHIASVSATLLAAQIALFTFALGTFLGRYSSILALALVSHPAVISVAIFATGLLIGSTTLLFFGFPAALASYLPWLALLPVPCFVISAWVAMSGVVADRAVTYAGYQYSKRIKKVLKRPLALPKSGPTFWQRVASVYGLYLRDPSSAFPVAPPESAVARIERYLMGLFNSAQRAIQDGQQEVFEAAIGAIYDVSASYTARRKEYVVSQDSVFKYLNDQIASLMQVTAKAPNEVLITRTLSLTGSVGRLSFDIGAAERAAKIYPALSQEGHPLALFWFALLQQGFFLSHSLERTVAPSVALDELERMAATGLVKDNPAVVILNFIPAIENIHKVCISVRDAYHASLSAQAFNNLLTVWFFATRKASAEAFHSINEAMTDALIRMVKAQVKLEEGRFLSPTLKGLPIVLAAKVEAMQPIIQDLFLAIGIRKREKSWEDSACGDQLANLLKLLGEVTEEAVGHKVLLTSYFGQALYELSFFVFKNTFHLPAQQRDEVVNGLFVAWETMLLAYSASEAISVDDWEQPMFGVLGLGVAAHKAGTSNYLRPHLLKAIQSYVKIVFDRAKGHQGIIEENILDYLQLLAVWVDSFLSERYLSRRIIFRVALGRLMSRGRSPRSANGILSSLGYPSLFYGDFSLPPMRNVQLSQDDLAEFEAARALVLDNHILVPFAISVRAVKRSIRRKFSRKR